MCETLDAVRLNFSPEGILLLSFVLFFIMFGVALEVKLSDFTAIFRDPRRPLIGLLSQVVLLPILSLGLVWLLKPCPSMALGMMLVGCCPGGNLSNFLTSLAKGNIALSVSVSAGSTLLAIVTTPFNFAFWSQFYPPAAELMQAISIDPKDVVVTIVLILALPMAIGMWVAQRFPEFTARIFRPVKVISMLLFAGYLVAALGANFSFVINYFQYVWWLVPVHNLSALAQGYFLSMATRLNEADRRAISIETGIQNSGLALALIFSPIFNGLGGMAMIAAFWGIWHIISGFILATIWSRFDPAKYEAA